MTAAETRILKRATAALNKRDVDGALRELERLGAMFRARAPKKRIAAIDRHHSKARYDADAEAAETARIREFCITRSVGRSEASGERSFLPLELDHFWGRGKVPQSTENCWMLTHDEHREKTENVGGRARYILLFRAHALKQGYSSQVAACDAALALEAAQHPAPATPKESA